MVFLLTYIKSSLVNKKTNAIIYNNPVLDENIKKIYNNIFKTENEIRQIGKELYVYRKIMFIYPHYLRAFDQLKEL